MSKSLGNFFTIRELLTTDRFGGRAWHGEVLRLAMLRTHYRQPIDWTVVSLEENLAVWVSFGNAIRDHAPATDHDDEFIDALLDDLNTPEAITRLFQLRDGAARGDINAARKLRKALEFLGFFSKFNLNFSLTTAENDTLQSVIDQICRLNGDIELNVVAKALSPTNGVGRQRAAHLLVRFVVGTDVRALRTVKDALCEIEAHDAARNAARAAKNWAESDRLRDELAAMGIQLKDGKDPVTGEPVTTWEVNR